MALPKPVDVTETPEWAALQEHFDRLQEEGVSLKRWFADDPGRVASMTFDVEDLRFDLSKNLVTGETLDLLVKLGRAVDLEGRFRSMVRGEHINTTEDRAVLHTALRRPKEQSGSFVVDGQDVVADVHETLASIYDFAAPSRPW